MLGLAGAAAGADERADAKAERARIEAVFKADLAACEARFVVTACVDDAKQRRRDALAPVRLRELQLDAVERQRRASERLVETQRKQAEVARHPADGASAARPERPAAPAPAASRAGKAAASRPLAAAPDTDAKKDAYARHEQAIQVHREQVEQRNAERAQQRPRAAPLPVPASSAAASSASR
jgi:hypothetical protein